jgi:hypothetical protein
VLFLVIYWLLIFCSLIQELEIFCRFGFDTLALICVKDIDRNQLATSQTSDNPKSNQSSKTNRDNDKV